MPIRSINANARQSSGKRINGGSMPGDFFNSLLTLKSKLVYAGGVCGRWGIDHNSDTAIWFHLVTHGKGWVHYPERARPVPIEEGDVVVFMPHAQKHYLSYSPRELVLDYPDARKTRFEDGTTGFVCAVIDLGLPKANLLRVLPPEVVVRKNEADRILANLIQHTTAEALQQRFGSFSVLERLCDTIFVLSLRNCIERGLVTQGVFVAMKDRRLQTVLSLIHREPWCPWTVEHLCAQAGISKTVLTEKFTDMMGCGPGEYLMRWRMQTAAHLLTESMLPLHVVAERCGYLSLSAFARKFKQNHGMSPGAYRRRVGTG